MLRKSIPAQWLLQQLFHYNSNKFSACMRYADKAESLVTYTAESCMIICNPIASSESTKYQLLLNKRSMWKITFLLLFALHII